MKSFENPFVNIAFNIVIPSILLTQLPFNALLTLTIALSFPILYGSYDLLIRKELNFISAIGFISVLLTGGIAVFELAPRWIAYKEAAVPLSIAVMVAISARTKDPVLKAIFFNETILDTKRIQERTMKRGTQEQVIRAFKHATYQLALVFLFSAFANFSLANAIVTAPSGTALFNEQIGIMTMTGFVVISAPTLILLMVIGFNLLRSIRKASDLLWDELIAEHAHMPYGSRQSEQCIRDNNPDEQSNGKFRRS